MFSSIFIFPSIVSSISPECGGVVHGVDFVCPSSGIALDSCDVELVAVATVDACCSACQARVPSCTSWSFNAIPSIKNNTLHGCYIKNATYPILTPFAARVSGYPAKVPPPPPPPPPPPACEPNCPLYGCLPPNDHHPWCDASLPVLQRAALVAGALTPAELVQQMEGSMPAVDRLGIPKYTYGLEALHGLIADCPLPGRCYTNFPCSSASVASFNRTLWHSIGHAQIAEVRGMWNDGLLPGLHVRGPQLNPQREPRWGRNDNSPGESAYMNGQYGAQMVLGGQGAGADGSYPLGEYRMALTEMKHFTAYSVENDRNTLPNTYNISLRDLAEYYFVPLKACIDEADVAAFMCSYNAINGTASCGNKWMNVDVVRNHWNWTGVIESDCGAVSGIIAHGNAKTHAEAAAIAIDATLDVECDSIYANDQTLLHLEELGIVKRSQLEAAVARVFKGRFQLGQFDPNKTMTGYDHLHTDQVFSKPHQDLSLDAARQSIVLLTNPDGAGAAKLPLKRGLNLAIIGPNGNVSDVYQGQYHGASCPDDPHNHYNYDCLPTAYSAIRKANVGGSTTVVVGCSEDKHREQTGPQSCTSLVDLDKVHAAAAAADVVILALGLDIKVTNSEGIDRSHDETGYALPGQQLQLVQNVAALNKPTVVILLGGMAVGIDWLVPHLKSKWPLLVPGYGGIFAPVAIAESVFGDYSPSGKLPYTVYPNKWASNTPMEDMSLTAGDGRTYKWYGYQNKALRAHFEFGDGISYTTFSITGSSSSSSNSSTSLLNRNSRNNDRPGTLSLGTYKITVTNTGNVAASEAVLAFVRPINVPGAPLPLPLKQIVDFGRTPVLAVGGGAAVLTFAVSEEDVSMVDWRGVRAAHAGKYEVLFSTGGSNSVGATVLRYNVTVASTVVIDTLPAPP